MFIVPDQADSLVPWKTVGISPHGKYYRPLPHSPWDDNTANKQLYRICVSCPPVPIKIISSKGLMHFTMTLWVRLRLSDGGGVIYARTTPLTTSKKSRVLFLLPKKIIGILRLELIPTQKCSRSLNTLLEVAQERENLGALLLLLTKLALQTNVQ